MLKLSFTVVLLAIVHTMVSSNDQVHEVLAAILNDDHLRFCELVFVSIKGTPAGDSATNLDVPIHPGSLPNYNTLESTAGTFIVEQGAQFNNNTDIITYHRLKDIHRFTSKHCGVAVLHISQVTPELPQRLFNTIIPRYLPIIRKDEDHFVFVFKSEPDAKQMLLSPEFGQKIKFKIGIMYPSKEEQPIIKKVDLYSENGECSIHSLNLPVSDVKSLFIEKRNFKGKQLRVVNPKAPSYFEMVPDGNGKTYRPVRGLYKVWLDVMMERFNFTIHLTLSSASGSTGKRLKNGTWVGSVGDILAGRADMASFNGHIYNRHEYVDWSAPLTYEWMVFITHKPKSFFSPSAIYRPFPVLLWIGILVSVIILFVMLKMMSKFGYRTALALKFRQMIMYISSSFLEQDGYMYMQVMHLHSVRVLLAFWLLFALIISTVYRGKLVSLIAFPAITWVPTTFEELAYSDYRVGLNVFGKGGATYSVLSTSKSPVYQTFFKKMELYPDPVNCLRAAFHYELGCLMVKSVSDFFGAKNFTNKFGVNPFQAGSQTALFREDGYIWEKRAVFRKHFDKVTWSMMETGLSNLWFQWDLEIVKKRRLDWEKQNPGVNSGIQITQELDGPSKLQVAHLVGLLYLYACGHITGVLCLTWEKLKFLLLIRKGSGNGNLREKIRHLPGNILALIYNSFTKYI